MRVTSISSVLVIALVACGSHGSAGDDGGTGDDGNGSGDDDGNHHGMTTVTVTVHGIPMNAAKFSYLAAYQDGSGPWQLAPAPNGDIYSLPINSPVWGFAWTCIGTPMVGTGPQPQQRQVSDLHFSVNERTSYTIDLPPRCTDRDNGAVLLKGSLANAPGGGTYVVRFGDRSVQTNFMNAYSLPVQPGTHDLVVVHGSFQIGNDFIADSAYVQRNLTVGGPTTANVDWDNAADVQTFGAGFTGNAQHYAGTTLYTKGGTTAPLVADSNPDFEIEGLDPNEQTTGDVYDIVMAASGLGQTVATSVATDTPIDDTFTAPTPLGGATSTVAATPYPIITTTWAAYANAVGYTWTATQQPSFIVCGNNMQCTISWEATLSAGVIGAMPSYSMPDLSQLTGWAPALQFVTGTQTAGTVQAMTSSVGAGDFPAATPPALGTARAFARSAYTVTP